MRSWLAGWCRIFLPVRVRPIATVWMLAARSRTPYCEDTISGYDHVTPAPSIWHICSVSFPKLRSAARRELIWQSDILYCGNFYKSAWVAPNVHDSCRNCPDPLLFYITFSSYREVPLFGVIERYKYLCSCRAED